MGGLSLTSALRHVQRILSERSARLAWAIFTTLTGGLISIWLVFGGAATSGIVWLGGTEQLFVDWRTYVAAVECTRIGEDPYDPASACIYGVGTPFGGIPSNAPPYFHDTLRLAGADASWGTSGGWVLLAIFFVAVACMPVSRSLWRLIVQSLALLAICSSPAGMLPFAKGNIELLFVALGVLAASLATSGGRLAVFAPWLLAVPASVKYIPGIAIGALMMVRSRVVLVSSVVVLVVLAVLGLITSASIGERVGLTAKATVNSFGSYVDATFLLGERPPLWVVAALVGIVILLGIALGLGVRSRCQISGGLVVRPLVFAAVGGLVVVSAWSIFANWEYRWLWTLLLLPLLTGGWLGRNMNALTLSVAGLVSIAPWITRTDVVRGPLTSALTMATVVGVVAVTTVSISALLRLRRG